MGNAQSQLYDLIDGTYAKYYPKSKYMRPSNVSTFVMVSGIGAQLFLNKQKSGDHLSSFILLSSTGANLGLQIWISFISGMTMIRLLPRQQFSLVQSHLFPKYFFMSSFLSFASLFAYLGFNPFNTWKNESLLLGCLFGTSFVLNILNHSFLNVKTIEYSSRMREIERLTGDDLNVVGPFKSDTQIENDPIYKRARRSFGIYHGLAVTGNLISMVSNIAQLVILSRKVHFSP